jgi:hypothetical protein
MSRDTRELSSIENLYEEKCTHLMDLLGVDSLPEEIENLCWSAAERGLEEPWWI